MRRLPAAPLKMLINDRKQDSGLSWRGFAASLGVSLRTLERTVERSDLAFETADKLAIRLGTHPVLLWGESWLEK